MSQLSEMIKELYPDGVEYRKLGEIARRICSGGTPTASNKLYYTGNIPWLRTQEIDWEDIYDTDIKISEEALQNSAARWIPANCVIIAMYGATAAKAAINRIPLTTNQACCNLEIDEEIANYKYVYYWICSQYERLKAKGQGSQSNINKKIIEEYFIPIPPLPIQNEIVKLLDNFTELTAELTAELMLRKKQYNFYRDSLLNFSRDDTAVTYEGVDEVSWYLTGDIFNLQNGYTPSKKQPSYWENGTIPWYRMEDIRTNGRILYDAIQHIHPSGVKSSLYPANSLLMTTTATIGEYALLMKPSLSNQQMTNFSIKEGFQEILNIKFAFYYFHVFAVWCKKNANQSGGMPIITVAKLKTFSFPIPPLEVQAKIVSILDRFDTLCNDLSQGLPAEIAARRKQYEYYRDKLLTFRRKGA